MIDIRKEKRKRNIVGCEHAPGGAGTGPEVLIEVRISCTRVKEAEDGSLRAHGDIDICVPGQAWLWVRSGGDGTLPTSEAKRGVEVQKYARGGCTD